MRQNARHTLTLSVLIGTLLALSACSGTSTPSGGGTGGGSTITMKDNAFDPAALTVKAGDTVTFKNADSVPHRIVVGTDDLGEQGPGEDKTWKAPKDGTYPMRCTIHPSMQGRITVGAGGGGNGTAPPGGGSSGY